MAREKIHLSDIGGFKEEKEFAKGIIDFLKNFDEYTKEGAYLPKGVLLLGEPGLGKTMLATAIADESGIPMFSLKGDGNSLVGENLFKTLAATFEEAKKNVPSILILDDLANFIPSSSSRGSDRGNDILNYILTQIDGIQNSDGIFIIATANNKWDIPQALCRAGRLENIITLNMPNVEEREQICEIYLRKSPMLSEVDPKELAVRMGSMSGAMIKRVINEGLIKALAKHQKPKASDFMPYIYSCMMEGLKKEGNPEDDKPTSIHEIGHFLCDHALNGKVGDISIEKYSSSRGSYRRFYGEEDEKEIKSKTAIFNEAVVSLGGLAAQEAILGEKYTGAYSDVRNLVSHIVKQITSGMFGFDVLTCDACSSYTVPEFAPSPMFHPFLNAYLSAAYQTALNIVKANQGFLEKLLPVLLERKFILSNEMDDFIKENPISKDFKIAKMGKVKPFQVQEDENVRKLYYWDKKALAEYKARKKPQI